ncbi:MAG: tRNA lysidine(34) synthetase TilS, partial [Caulobacteraceae bacterium]
ALLCVAGGGRPARGARLERLLGRLVGPTPFAATLAGARVEADGAWIGIAREAADRRRAGGGPTPLPEGAPIVWDGRFEIEASVGGLTVTPLRGLVKRLAPAARAALKSVPAAARPGLPAVRDAAGAVSCPALVPDPRLAARPLAFSRLASALGAVDGEVAIARVAETLRTP